MTAWWVRVGMSIAGDNPLGGIRSVAGAVIGPASRRCRHRPADRRRAGRRRAPPRGSTRHCHRSGGFLAIPDDAEHPVPGPEPWPAWARTGRTEGRGRRRRPASPPAVATPSKYSALFIGARRALWLLLKPDGLAGAASPLALGGGADRRGCRGDVAGTLSTIGPPSSNIRPAPRPGPRRENLTGLVGRPAAGRSTVLADFAGRGAVGAALRRGRRRSTRPGVNTASPFIAVCRRLPDDRAEADRPARYLGLANPAGLRRRGGGQYWRPRRDLRRAGRRRPGDLGLAQRSGRRPES